MNDNLTEAHRSLYYPAPVSARSQYHPYRDRAYAEALADIKRLVEVGPWGTWVQIRPIGESSLQAAGLYPLLSLAGDADIPAGRDHLRKAGLVSFVGVSDPFTSPPLSVLVHNFEVCRPFKQHAVVDRRLGQTDFSRHHRSEIKRALRACVVEKVTFREHLDRWTELYDELSDRRNITGVQRFSRRYFLHLAAMPSLTCFAAHRNGLIVAMSLWVRGGQVAYNHLGASSAEGYKCSASYALYAAAIEDYSDCEIINLGGSAGLQDAEDGLLRFKRGFANSSATAHLCGMILDREAHQTLCGSSPSDTYFPPYRDPSRATPAKS
jgi:hypothetical protein